MTADSASGAVVHPVILSGGAGTRLWPVSRALYPKQLVPLVGPLSLMQQTVERVADCGRYAPPLIICNGEQRFIVAEQLEALGRRPAGIVLEPVGRNTAPAVAVAARLLVEADPEAVMLILPSDHLIRDRAAFDRAVATAAQGARQGALLTFGIKPERPETGYGYIRRGAPLEAAEGCFQVERFVEKPDLATAEGYLGEPTMYWNSGMFLFGARRFLEELEALAPEIAAAAATAVAEGERRDGCLHLGEAAFAAAPAISIDYAVMEHTRAAAVVPAELDWHDLGSWTALWEIGEQDGAGNVVSGDVIAQGSRGSYLRSEGPLVAAVGVSDLVVVAMDDVVLVADKGRAQEVKAVVEELAARGRAEHQVHSRVYRPWGSYQGVDMGERFQVKRLTVKPGARLSLQKHHHRAEHWVVVQGTARVTRGEESFLLHENESTYIPMGVTHRLENPGKIPLHIIEIQSGSYLGEDDIVRFEDTYGRA